MRKTLVGILGGAAAAYLAVWLFDVGPDSSDFLIQQAADTPDPSSLAPVAFDNSQIAQESPENNPVSGAVAEESVVPTRRMPELPEDDAVREVRLRAEIEDTQRALADLRAELEELAIVRELAAEPIISPITLPPEFEWIAENTYRSLFHERMQREPIDVGWAGAIGPELESFIYNQPEIVQKYGAPTVRCHTTRCEVTFLSTGVIDDPSVARADARALFEASLVEMDGRFNCGPGECWAEAETQDGIVTIFWGMTKDENQTQSLVSVATTLR
jgi:hypothetical protein